MFLIAYFLILSKSLANDATNHIVSELVDNSQVQHDDIANLERKVDQINNHSLSEITDYLLKGFPVKFSVFMESRFRGRFHNDSFYSFPNISVSDPFNTIALEASINTNILRGHIFYNFIRSFVRGRVSFDIKDLIITPFYNDDRVFFGSSSLITIFDTEESTSNLRPSNTAPSNFYGVSSSFAKNFGMYTLDARALISGSTRDNSLLAFVINNDFNINHRNDFLLSLNFLQQNNKDPIEEKGIFSVHTQYRYRNEIINSLSLNFEYSQNLDYSKREVSTSRLNILSNLKLYKNAAILIDARLRAEDNFMRAGLYDSGSEFTTSYFVRRDNRNRILNFFGIDLAEPILNINERSIAFLQFHLLQDTIWSPSISVSNVYINRAVPPMIDSSSLDNIGVLTVDNLFTFDFWRLSFPITLRLDRIKAGTKLSYNDSELDFSVLLLQDQYFIDTLLNISIPINDRFIIDYMAILNLDDSYEYNDLFAQFNSRLELIASNIMTSPFIVYGSSYMLVGYDFNMKKKYEENLSFINHLYGEIHLNDQIADGLNLSLVLLIGYENKFKYGYRFDADYSINSILTFNAGIGWIDNKVSRRNPRLPVTKYEIRDNTTFNVRFSLSI